MGLRIKTNIESQIAQRMLNDSRGAMTDSLQKLSSGLRINKSADDAAGLAVSEGMQAKVKSLAQAKRNANDGISFLQVAEGGLSSINNMVVRMRELTTQAASDTIGSQERVFLNREFGQLGAEITRIVGETEFNGRKILQNDGVGENGLGIQVGASFHTPGKEVNTENDTIRIKVDQINELNDTLGALKDLNIEGETGDALGGGETVGIFEKLDLAMNKVTDFRASLGAIGSRISSTVTAIDVGIENIEAAKSRIRDVDYTTETAKLTQNKILMSAGTAVLSQANQLPEQVLALLR